MAVTAKFVADFSNFDAAVKKAEIELRQFEDGAAKVRTSLERMSNALSGRRVIQEALLMAEAIERVGGVTKLTANELQRANAVMTEATAKMKALGQTAPTSFQAIATATKAATTSGEQFTAVLGKASRLLATFGVGLSVGAVIGFGKSLLADADALVKLSDQTGISTQWLQRFQVAGDDAGVSIESMTTGINQMQKRLIGGDASFVGALQTLNINLADFKRLGPAEQFVAISDALRQVSDPAARTALAIATMGRAGAENLPVLVRGFDDVKDAAIGMSEDTVKKLDLLGDAFGRLWRTTKSALAGIAVAIADNTALGALVNMRVEAERVNEALLKVAKTAKALPTNAQTGPIGVPDAAGMLAVEQELAAAVDATKKQAAELARAEAAAAKAIDDAWRALWEDLLKNVARVEDAVDRGAFKLLSFADAVKQIPIGAIGGVEPVIVGFDQLDTILVKDLLHAQQLAVVFDQFGRRHGLLIEVPKDAVSRIEQMRTALGAVNTILTSISGTFAEVGAIAARTGESLIKALLPKGGLPKDLFGAIVAGATGAIAIVSKFWDALTGGEAKRVNRMRDADEFLKSLGKNLGEVAEKARRAGVDIQGALQAKTVEAYRKEIDKLKDALDFQTLAMDELAAAEDEYHFTASKNAGDLYKKYRLLTGAGYDQLDVLQRQADGWQQLVSDSLKFGTVLPGQIKDLIQQLIDMGQITDENGNVLTDISRIRFTDVGASGADAFDKMTTAIDKLVAAIKQSLGIALSDIEKQLLGIKDQIVNMPQFPNGSYPTRNGPQPYPDTGLAPALTAPGWAGPLAVQTVINLDGRQIAAVVSKHQLNAARNRQPAKAA